MLIMLVRSPSFAIWISYSRNLSQVKTCELLKSQIFMNKTFVTIGKPLSMGVAVGHTYYIARKGKWISRSRMQMRLRQGNWCKLNEWVTELHVWSGDYCSRPLCLWGSLESSCWTNSTLPARERQHPIAVVKEGVIVRHMPCAAFLVCYLFLRRNCILRCQVTNTRYYSIVLPQGGLEIPCRLIFSIHARLIAKV